MSEMAVASVVAAVLLAAVSLGLILFLVVTVAFYLVTERTRKITRMGGGS